MKTLVISEVIEILEGLKKDHGDISVLCFDYETSFNRVLSERSFLVESKLDSSNDADSVTDKVISICA